MCKHCLMSNCPSGCPNYDPPICGNCDECGCDICAEEDYYDFDGENICEDCIWDYLKQFKRKAEEHEPDYDDRND